MLNLYINDILYVQATKALEYARSVILYQTNSYPTLKHEIRAVPKEELSALESLLLRQRSYARSPSYKFYAYLNMLRANHVGNCFEYALMAWLYYEFEPEWPIFPKVKEVKREIFEVIGSKAGNGDHVILVINRAEGSNPEKPETWGNFCYICDPWANCVFPASQYKKFLKSYYKNLVVIKTENSEDSSIVLEENVEPFNEMFHKLALSSYFLKNVEKMKSEANSLLKELVEELSSFVRGEVSNCASKKAKLAQILITLQNLMVISAYKSGFQLMKEFDLYVHNILSILEEGNSALKRDPFYMELLEIKKGIFFSRKL